MVTETLNLNEVLFNKPGSGAGTRIVHYIIRNWNKDKCYAENVFLSSVTNQTIPKKYNLEKW